AHMNGRQRRSPPSGVGRLVSRRRALRAGASTAEAAKYALESVVTDPAAAEVLPQPRRGGQMEQETPRASRLARGLSAAVLRLDSHQAQLQVEEAVPTVGPAVAWEEVVRPVAE